VGIAEIAEMLSLERKLVYVIGGRPGTGKSALLQQILENIAGQGFGCIFPSLEMHNVQVGMRALAAESGVPFAVIKAGNVHNRGLITKAIETLSRLDIEVDERPRQSLAYIRKWVIRRKREGELGKRAPLFLVGIDYAQMLAASNPRLPRHEHHGFGQ
jgi:replicative DNA helicase